MNETIGLKELREKHGLTQIQLAELLGYANENSDETAKKNAIRKVIRAEKGETDMAMHMFFKACEILNETVSFSKGEFKMVSVNNSIDLISLLELQDENQAKTIQYNGLKEVLPAWRQWWREFDTAVNRYGNGKADDTWLEKNRFLVLFSRHTKEVKAIRSYGQHFVEPDMFLYASEWTPIFTHIPPKTDEELIKRIASICEMLDSFENTFDEDKNPIVLLCHILDDDYLAYSIREQKYLIIYSYKEYRTSFGISEVDNNDIIEITDKYRIYPFTKKIIEELGLDLYPADWRFISAWNKWEYRNPKTPASQDFGKYNELYTKVLNAINSLRTNPNNRSELCNKLENRIERFERLFELGAPEEIIQRDAELLKRGLKEMES